LRFRQADPHGVADAEFLCDFGAGFTLDHMIETPCELAFIRLGEMGMQHGGDHKAEHPVTQKFKPLIAAGNGFRR